MVHVGLDFAAAGDRAALDAQPVGAHLGPDPVGGEAGRDRRRQRAAGAVGVVEEDYSGLASKEERVQPLWEDLVNPITRVIRVIVTPVLPDELQSKLCVL